MITFIYGDDGAKTRKKLEAEKAAFLKKFSDGTIVIVESDTAAEDMLFELSEEGALFSAPQLFILRGWCDTDETQERLLAALSALADAKRQFVVYENGLDERTAKKISGHAKETHACIGPVGQKKEFNIFDLARAFGERDKKGLWMLLVEALDQGIAPEEIHGTLFWQAKAITLAKDAAEGREANSGLNPFVLKNASRYQKNFKEKEIAALAGNLVSMYHEAHQGEIEFGHALERFALTI